MDLVRNKLGNYFNRPRRIFSIIYEDVGEDEYCEGVLEGVKEVSDGVIRNRVIFGVFRGRMSEGIDLSSVEIAVLVGVPFLKRKDVVVQARRRYMEGKFEMGRKIWKNIYLGEAMAAYNQVIGRMLRKKTDVGVVLMIDLRMKDLLSRVPRWVQKCRVQVQDDEANFLNDVKVFMDRVSPSKCKPTAAMLIEEAMKKRKLKDDLLLSISFTDRVLMDKEAVEAVEAKRMEYEREMYPWKRGNGDGCTVDDVESSDDEHTDESFLSSLTEGTTTLVEGVSELFSANLVGLMDKDFDTFGDEREASDAVDEGENTMLTADQVMELANERVSVVSESELVMTPLINDFLEMVDDAVIVPPTMSLKNESFTDEASRVMSLVEADTAGIVDSQTGQMKTIVGFGNEMNGAQVKRLMVAVDSAETDRQLMSKMTEDSRSDVVDSTPVKKAKMEMSLSVNVQSEPGMWSLMDGSEIVLSDSDWEESEAVVGVCCWARENVMPSLWEEVVEWPSLIVGPAELKRQHVTCRRLRGR